MCCVHLSGRKWQRERNGVITRLSCSALSTSEKGEAESERECVCVCAGAGADAREMEGERESLSRRVSEQHAHVRV